MTNSPYVKERERYGRADPYLDTAAFVTDLAGALGATVDTAPEGEFEAGSLTLGELRVWVRPMFGKLGRVSIGVGAPALSAKIAGYRTPITWPEATADTARPLDKLATDIRKRVVDAAAEPLAALKVQVSEHEAEKAAVATRAAELRARFPKLRVEVSSDGTSGSIYYGDGLYLSGRFQGSGKIYLERVTVSGDRVEAVLAAFLD